jgi:hypothetical protein
MRQEGDQLLSEYGEYVDAMEWEGKSPEEIMTFEEWKAWKEGDSQ